MGKRLQVELSDDAYERLKSAAEAEERSIAELVRRALNIEDYVRKQVDEGSKVVIQSEDGRDQEILIV